MLQALKDCDLKPADIDRIVLVGGSTPGSKALQKFFGGKTADRSVNRTKPWRWELQSRQGAGWWVENILLLDDAAVTGN